MHTESKRSGRNVQVGDILLYWGGEADPGFQLGPLAAIVAYVGAPIENDAEPGGFEPRVLNLHVIDREGQGHARPNVKLFDDASRVTPGTSYAGWPGEPKDVPTYDETRAAAKAKKAA